MYRRIAISLLCAALGWSCSKSISYDTVYVVKPWMQAKNQGTLISLEGAKTFAFAVDTIEWEVASFEDALNGVITRKNMPSQRNDQPVAIGEPFGVVDTIPTSVNWLKMSLAGPSMMVVAVDPSDSLYAYTRQNFIENLSPLYVSVTFQPWRDDIKRYTNGSWVYVNDFYDPDAKKWTDYVLKPKVQLADKGDVTSQLNVDLYAFAVDTADWYVASYIDAENRIITSKKDPKDKLNKPNYVAQPDKSGAADGWRRFSSNDKMLMVIAVNPDQEMYAYRRLDVTLNNNEQTEELVFRPWKPAKLYVEGSGWRVMPPGVEEPVPTQTVRKR